MKVNAACRVSVICYANTRGSPTLPPNLLIKGLSWIKVLTALLPTLIWEQYFLVPCASPLHLLPREFRGHRDPEFSMKLVSFCTLHFALCTLHFALCILHFAFCILHLTCVATLIHLFSRKINGLPKKFISYHRQSARDFEKNEKLKNPPLHKATENAHTKHSRRFFCKLRFAI